MTRRVHRHLSSINITHVGRRKVVVVSFWGKSSYNTRSCKAGLVDLALDREVFQLPLGQHPQLDGDELFDIEGFYSPSHRVIYLHLRGPYDTFTLTQLCEKAVTELEEKSFLGVWGNMKYKYARALLLLFSISHVLVLANPTPAFDITYIHLFRALDAVRLKVQAAASKLLQEIPGIPKDWASYARLCSPRVLFLFERCPAHLREKSEEAAEAARKVLEQQNGKGRSSSKNSSIKKLELALEDQIYHVLRRSRVITNISANSLFAIPANLEFVYVCNNGQWLTDSFTLLVNQLMEFCLDSSSDSPVNVSTDETESAGASGGASGGSSAGASADTPPSTPTVPTVPTVTGNVPEHSFYKFLKQHIDQAFTKGFDDNVGRHAGPGFFEVPTTSVWFAACNKLYDFYISEPSEKDYKIKQAFIHLKTVLDIDVKFSEGRCGKVLPLALAAYQENLPTHYTQDYHETKLNRAIALLCLHARGPACESFMSQLEEECERYWRNGRQMCEVLSLRGNHCTNPLHQALPDEEFFGKDPEDKDKSLPVISHSSGVRYVSICNCGRKQASREDPFSARAANHDFYESVAKDCCDLLDSITFPVFQPSIKEYRAAQLVSPNESKDEESKNGVQARDGSPSVEQALQGLSLVGRSGGSDLAPAEAASRLSNQMQPAEEQKSMSEGQKVIIDVTECNQNDGKDKWLVRQPSTTEYLPGMLHSDSPPGLLPRFPSWSLVCLGPSSLYSHNVGLHHEQPGFIPGTSFLLPWDVTVKMDGKERGWKAAHLVVRGGGKKGRGGGGVVAAGSGGGGGDGGMEITVKIFIGVEYECPRGHRFMGAAPDKVLRTTGQGLVKDTANRVTANDMPLYFPCPCRSNKQLIGQLMRIHVVTPKAPVYVTLNPRIQPAPAPCPVFVCGLEEPIKLTQSAYWVLRLPYSYASDQGPYLPPKEPVLASFGRLLKGVYGITPIAPTE